MPVPFFIAEISSNHVTTSEGPDLSRALKLVEAAAACGANSVKVQLFSIDKLFAPEIVANSPVHQERRNWELPAEFLPDLYRRAHELGLQFGVTPFDLDSLAQALPWCDFLKIASYEMGWPDLLKACAQSGKPTVLSTGMTYLREVRAAVRLYQAESGAGPLTLLHCVSAYPTPVAAANLLAIDKMRRSLGLPCGWSDHSHDPAVILAAALRHQAAMIEFHFDLDESGVEFAPGHCWLPGEIKPLIDLVRQAVAASGDGIKRPQPCEMAERDWRADPEDGLRPLKKTRKKTRLL